MDLKAMDQRRFATLLAATRWPASDLMFRELEWYSTAREGLLGTVVLDLTDGDFSWMVLGKDRQGCYRPIRQCVSLPSQVEARRQLKTAMAEACTQYGRDASCAGLADAVFDKHSDATLGPLAESAGISQEEAYARMVEAQAQWVSDYAAFVRQQMKPTGSKEVAK
jgi:hypothetical protein